MATEYLGQVSLDLGSAVRRYSVKPTVWPSVVNCAAKFDALRASQASMMREYNARMWLSLMSVPAFTNGAPRTLGRRDCVSHLMRTS